MESESRMISEYNDALNQIMRLNQMWVDARAAREGGNMLKLKNILDSAEIELTEDAKFVDKRDKNKEKETYVAQLGAVNGKIKKSKKLAEYYGYFREKELLLREIQRLSGKGGKFKREDEDKM